MRVLQLLSSTGFHGAESMAAELVRQLHALDVTIDVAVFENDGRGDKTILSATEAYARRILTIPCRGQFDIGALHQLRRLMIDGAIDLVHSHKYKTTFYSLNARIGTPTRIVATYHNWLSNTRALRFYAALDKHLAKYCSAAIGVSQEVCNELRKHAAAEKVHHIDNGIDTNRFQSQLPTKNEARSALGIPEISRVIGFVGRLSAPKGVSLLLKAVAGLPPVLRDHLTLVIAGDGEERPSLETEARDLGIFDQTIFLGTRRDISTVYAAMDVFALPSEVEAFPMVVLEAMACGIPVIATAVGDIPRIVREGISGYVIRSRDLLGLRDRLIDLLSNDAIARAMGSAGKILAQDHTSKRMATDYLAIYRCILAKPTN